MKRLCWMLILMFSVFGIEVFSKEWNGLIPRVSTRLEAEKILGKASFPSNMDIYRYKKFRVHINYEQKVENNSDKDVVKMITVYPDKTETLARYIKKIPNFQKDFVKREIDIKVGHIYGYAGYINYAEGFSIIVQKDPSTDVEIIHGFEYFAPVSR